MQTAIASQHVARLGLPKARAFAPVRPALARCVRPQAAKTDDASKQERQPQAHLLLPAAALLASLVDVPAAFSADGSYGLLEGRTAALIHPAVMFFLFGSTVYAGYLGLQLRRTRELGVEIRDLRKSAPAPAAEGAPAVDSPVTRHIQEKEALRKELQAGNFKDKHWWWGSLLLASGTGIAIEGAVNTYMRTGKLFPGPHLYAGAGIVALWALAASLTPAMLKGNETARVAHISLNVVNLLLFTSQIPTGLEIVGKVFQFTQWP